MGKVKDRGAGVAPPKMTATQARRFERKSPSSAVQVVAAFACGCQPYADVFTFRRWAAQGFVPSRGQKAFKLATFVPVPNTEDADGAPRLLPRSLPVFCRCQVVPMASGSGVAS